MKTCVCDGGWGDSGKGKITDLLAPEFDLCVKYNGGANAGHTIQVGDNKFALHLLPAGILQDCTGVLASAMAIDPVLLRKEIETIEESLQHEIELKVARNAHCVLPWHLQADARKGGKIGTTRKGIGPTYADKAHRWNAIRMENLLEKLESESTTRFFAADEVLHGKGLWTKYHEAAEFLQPYICDTGSYLRQAVKDDKNILFEMSNGIHLDVDWGTYPYVTSSAVGPSAIPQSCGLPNLHLDRIIMVIKCHATRVGGGPFPSELWPDYHDGELMWLRESEHGKDMTMAEVRDHIRTKGKEFGTTTGRPRRIGWFDMDMTRLAVELTGATEVALMHADTAAGLREVGMRIDGTTKRFPGWENEKSHEFDNYVHAIEDGLGIPVTMISYGPDREQTLMRSSE